MSNLNTKSGKNNCCWNIKGKCTRAYYKGEVVRAWDSKLNCTMTQEGAQSICSGYFFEGNKDERRKESIPKHERD